MADPTPRLLITRLSHIGDCLLTLPLVAELRRQYPDAHIAWACERAGGQLVGLHPAVDEVITVPRNWLRKPSEWWRLTGHLRARGFDIAIDPQGLLKSSLLGRLSGARRRLGFRGEYGREGSAKLNNRLCEPKSEHLVDRTLELLSLLDLPQPVAAANLQLPVPPEAQRQVAACLDQLPFPCFAVLNPGASWPSKQWDPDRFGAVAQSLFQTWQIVPLITWSGPEESAMADRIVEISRGAAVKCPATSLVELAAILAQAEFFLGCDTGPLHLAAAVGTPCIGLYGPTLPTRSGAYGPQHIALQKWFQDGTRRERRSASNDAMLAITTQDVIAATTQLLERHPRAQVS